MRPAIHRIAEALARRQAVPGADPEERPVLAQPAPFSQSRLSRAFRPFTTQILQVRTGRDEASGVRLAPPARALQAHWTGSRSQIVALPETIDPLEAAMLEPLGVAIHAVDLAKPRPLERMASLSAGPIGLLILQVLKVAGADDVRVIEPLAHRRAAALGLGAKEVFATTDEFINGPGKGGRPLVIEATDSSFGFRDAVRASRIGGRVVLAGVPDGDAYALPASEARRRGLKIKFVRRMGDDYPRAIELVTSSRVNVRALVTHRKGLNAAHELFEALALGRPGYVKALLYPNGKKLSSN
jgi:L-iditol 2-dehydrogenase